MPFNDAGTPRQGEAGGDGFEVLAEEAGEALHRLRRVLLGLADPLQQQVAAPVTHEVGEDAGQVAGPGDVRAGEPDLQQPPVLALGQGLAGPHDPGGDLARTRDVGPDRLGGAHPQGGKVFADDLAAAAVAARSSAPASAQTSAPAPCGDTSTAPSPPLWRARTCCGVRPASSPGPSGCRQCRSAEPHRCRRPSAWS